MSDRPTVWCTQDTKHNYSSANQRGDLVFLYEDKVNVFATDMLASEIREKLKGSKEDDFLIPSGNAIAACIAFSVLMEKHGVVNVLIFSFRSNLYEIRSIRKAQVLAPVEKSPYESDVR